MRATLAVTRSLDIKASQEQVWENLTDPDAIAVWLTGFHFDSFEPGAKFSNGADDDASGEILSIDPPRSVSFRWTAEHKRQRMTLVSITLEPVHAGTRVSVTESCFEQLDDAVLRSAFERACKGWGVALETLADMVEEVGVNAGNGAPVG